LEGLADAVDWLIGVGRKDFCVLIVLCVLNVPRAGPLKP
jgi:hypothetical protein